MDDGADICLVDPHTESNGGNDDLERAVEEFALRALALLGAQAGMVSSGREVRGKRGRGLLRVLAGGRVDDGRTACWIAQELERALGAHRFRHLGDFDGEIVAAEAVDEPQR